MPAIFPPTTHIARREHTCAECGEAIPAGSAYDAQTVMEPSRVTTRRTHTTCYSKGPTDHLF